MLLEMSYDDYTQGTQRRSSLQGYTVNGLMIFASDEAVETATYVTVRCSLGTLVPRVELDKLHQISDFVAGNADDDTATTNGFTYIPLGVLSLSDDEELEVILDCDSGAAGTIKIGVAAIIAELPVTDEVIYAYDLHTDASFSAEAASALYVFMSSIQTSGLLVNVKLGDRMRSTTFRATNWYANLMGKIETDNSDMGVVFDQKFGQSMVCNHGGGVAVTSIVRRVVQTDPVRKAAARRRIQRQIANTVQSVDKSSLNAVR